MGFVSTRMPGANVGDQKVDAHVRHQHLEAGDAVRRLDGAVAQVFQHLHHQHPDRRLVVDR
ncbi:hypothetical protein [Methylobacterium komagatae]